MADKTTPVTEDEFTVVSDPNQTVQENKLSFDTLGEQWIADKYLGMRDMGMYKQARFEKGGEIYFINANYSLRDGLKNVRTGTGPVRLTFSDEVDTGQENMMRVYIVEVAKRRPPVK
jgi:hypothetical protein